MASLSPHDQLVDPGGAAPPQVVPRLAGLRRLAEACGQPETGLFLGFWLILLFRGRSFFLQDPGTFWHTVTGQRILESGTLPTTDPYSYTFAGQPWVPYEWLSECAMAWLHAFDGFSTLVLAGATLLAALFAWLDGRMVRSGMSRSLAILIVGLAMVASSCHFLVRPHLFTMVFLAVTTAALCAYEARRIEVGRLFWLVPLFVLWSNLHGGVLGGIGTVALAGIGWAVWRVIGFPSPFAGGRSFILLALLVTACGCAALVSPFGIELPRTWFRIILAPGLENLGGSEYENAPLHLRELYAWSGLALGFVYLALLVSVRPFKPRVMWLIPLVWLVLAFSAVRHLPLFAISAVVVLPDLVPHTALAPWLTRRGWLEPRQLAPRPLWERGAPWLIPAAVVLAALGVQASGARVPLIGHDWAQLDPAVWPIELLPELRAHEQLRPGGTRIWNDCRFGGFLIYHTPGYRIFGDDRCEVYGGPWLAAYLADDEAGCRQRFDDWERRYGAPDLALTQTGTTQDLYFRRAGERWQLVGQTHGHKTGATLYRRR